MKTVKSIFLKCSIVFFVVVQLLSFDVFASHIPGGSITYKSLGANRFYVETMVLRECRGANFSSWTETVDAVCTSNSRRGWTTYTVTHLPFVAPPVKFGGPYSSIKVSAGTNTLDAREVSDVCDSILNPSIYPNSICRTNGSATQGYTQFKFSAIITLSACNWWRLGFAPVCCRNTTNSNTRSGGIYIHTFLNTKDYPSNSAPLFNDENAPAQSAYVGKKIVFSLGAHDQDGDSLRFELTCAMQDSTRCVQYNTGFTASTPVRGITMDSLTGIVSCTPSTVGKRVIAYWVKEYERCTGKLKAKTLRDMQIVVEASSNKLPFVKTPLHNITGGAFINSKGELAVREGQLISWDQTFADSNTTDSIYVTTNLDKVLPGATYTIVPTGRKNEIIVRTKWKAKIGISPRKIITYKFNDDYCPYPGKGANAVSIVIGPSVGISSSSGGVGNSINACIADTVRLTAIGGTKFSWRSLSGNTLQTGINWFPDTNAVDTNKSVKFVVTQSTKFEVTALSLYKYCGKHISYLKTTDTIDVIATDSFQLSGKRMTLLCNPSRDTLSIEPSNKSLTYTYNWQPKTLLINDSTKNPVLKSLAHDQQLVVTVTSTGSCTREHITDVKMAPSLPINNTISDLPPYACIGDTASLALTLGEVVYDSCTTTNLQCLGKVVKKTVGLGAAKSDTVNESYPLVYGTKNKSGKLQLLYSATELKQLGIKQGLLTSISFDVAALPSNVGTYKDFRIKIGCSSNSHLAQLSTTPLQEVYATTSYTHQIGWNVHDFDKNYAWDGTSNLLVQICWVMNSTSAAHPAITMDNVSFIASNLLTQKTDSIACTATTNGGGYFFRPRTEFGYCDGLNKKNYRFKWSAIPTTAQSGFISKSDSSEIVFVPGLNTARKYVVELSDSAGVCRDTISKTIQVLTKYNTKIDSIPPICNPNGPVQFKAATPANVTTPGGKWSGVGIVDSRKGTWDRNRSGKGLFTVFYEITGNSCASKDSATVQVLDLPVGAIKPIDFVCSQSSDVPEHELIGLTPGGVFLGFGVETKTVGGKQVFYVNGKRFSPTLTNPDTIRVRHLVGTGSCRNDTIIKIPVLPQWDTTYLGVIHNGVPYFTKRFCATGGSDTLLVRGKNAIWRMADPKYKNAIVDSIHGIFKPALVNNGKGGTVKIEVENKGFCGAKGSFYVELNPAPEVRILNEDFCFKIPGNCVGSNVPTNLELDTLKVRVAKNPFVKIDDADPATYVDVDNATSANSGWAGITGKQGSWNGYFWMNYNNKCEHRFCSLPKGKYPLGYRLGVSYRPWKKDSICYSYDSVSVDINNNYDLQFGLTGTLCNNGTVELIATTNKGPSTYVWADGTPGDRLRTNQPGNYTVRASYQYCETEKSYNLTSCVGIEEITSELTAAVYPNPAKDRVVIEAKNVYSKINLTLFTLDGKTIDSYALAPDNGKVKVDVEVGYLPVGVYLFKLQSGEQVSVFRVMVE